MFKTYAQFITLFTLFIFSGCTKNIDFLATKVSKQDLQRYLPEQEKKIRGSIENTKYIAFDWGSALRERARYRTISEITSLIGKINIPRHFIFR